jgi:hypothetical protein
VDGHVPHNPDGKSAKNDLAAFLTTARRELEPYCGKIGLVIYSAVDTLASNPVIFWGFNPGQDPTVSDPTHWTITEALTRFPTQKESLLLQVWPDAKSRTRNEGGKRVYRRSFPAGGAPYQRGIRHLLSAIGHFGEGTNFPEPLVTNFLFVQTGSAREAGAMPNIKDIVERCWRVHEQIFSIAQPRVLITSASVLEYVRRFNLMDLNATDEQPIPTGYFNWCCKRWETVIEHGRVVVLQVPHMSYWGGCIEKEKSQKAVKWVAKMVRNALAV